MYLHDCAALACACSSTPRRLLVRAAGSRSPASGFLRAVKAMPLKGSHHAVLQVAEHPTLIFAGVHFAFINSQSRGSSDSHPSCPASARYSPFCTSTCISSPLIVINSQVIDSKEVGQQSRNRCCGMEACWRVHCCGRRRGAPPGKEAGNVI